MTRARATRLLIGLLAVALGLACTAALQRRLDAMRVRDTGERLLYLPNEKVLNHFCAGMDSVVADFLWLGCVQYTASHFHSDRQFVWLNHMADMIMRLDPYNVAVCRLLSMFLAALKADDNASMELLKRGMVANPFAWELPYEAALTYLLNRRDDPDTPAKAAAYLALAVETGKAPPFVLEVAQGLHRQANMIDVERSMWESVRASGDAFMRELAERKLCQLNLRVACMELNKAMGLYQRHHGRPAGSLQELVTGGIVAGVPGDPLGGRFFIDVDGRVRNTTILDEEVERVRNNLRTAIESFRTTRNRLPASLDELVTQHIMDTVPPHPYLGKAWRYDPATGALE